MGVIDFIEEALNVKETLEKNKCNLINLDIHKLELSSFPKGSCEISAQVMAQWLIGKGVNEEDLIVVRGKHYKNKVDHTWLEIDGLIIDVTASQFLGGDKVVYKDRIFHGMFHGQNGTGINKNSCLSFNFYDFEKIMNAPK
jgi:hypothetical protein